MYLLYLLYRSIGSEFVARKARSAQRATSELPITRIYCIYFICIYVCIYCIYILYLCMYCIYVFGVSEANLLHAKREAQSVLRVSFRLRVFTISTLYVFTYIYTVCIYFIFVCIYVFIYCIYVCIYFIYCTKLQMRRSAHRSARLKNNKMEVIQSRYSNLFRPILKELALTNRPRIRLTQKNNG